MNFKKWLLEVGMGGGGAGSGMMPPKEDPVQMITGNNTGGFQVWSDESGSDPADPNGQLPPTTKKIKKLKKSKK
jgi:hypothetical protein